MFYLPFEQSSAIQRRILRFFLKDAASLCVLVFSNLNEESVVMMVEKLQVEKSVFLLMFLDLVFVDVFGSYFS